MHRTVACSSMSLMCVKVNVHGRASLFSQHAQVRVEQQARRDGCVPGLHELHDLVFVEHHPPRGRLAAGQQHPPLGAWPVLAGTCSEWQHTVRGLTKEPGILGGRG